MGFFMGMLFGFLIGIGIICGLVYMMGRRGVQRGKKTADIKLLGELNQDDVKKLCGGEQPLWISFPQFERVRWLNKQLEKIWPSVAAAARVIIIDSVEPILEQYRPVGIAALNFKKLFLGNVAPQIEGVRLQTLKPGQLTMDLDFRWGGDPSIILGVRTLIGAVLPVQLKNFKFFATVRVIFQLCDEIPCISAVVVALLAKPKPEIKYTIKIIGGSLTAVPGLADKITDLVENIITDQLQWPHRIVVPISPNAGDLSHLELKLQGRVTVTVKRAEKLKNMERVGKSDPYVTLHVRPLFKRKTVTINNNLNPVWDTTFELYVEDQETQAIFFKVLDADIGLDKTLGVTQYPLIKLVPEKSITLELPLQPSLDTDRVKDKKDRGSLIVELHYHVFTPAECETAMKEEKEEIAKKEKMKEEGLINSTTDAVGGVVGGVGKVAFGGVVGGVGIVGSGVGMVGTGLVKGGKALTRGMGNSMGNVSRKNREAAAANGTAK